MQTTIQNTSSFITYLMSKPGASDTDRLVFLLQVLKPDLFKQALAQVFPAKNHTVNNESPAVLRQFVKENADEFSLPNGTWKGWTMPWLSMPCFCEQGGINSYGQCIGKATEKTAKYGIL